MRANQSKNHKPGAFQILYDISSITTDGNSHRITALDKIEDKYEYGEMNFPASFDDLKQLEDDDQTNSQHLLFEQQPRIYKHARRQCFTLYKRKD
jgi:hypothetical protein